MPARRLWTTPTTAVDVEISGNEVRWGAYSWIDPAVVDANKERGKRTGRAPLGDSHGAWQKCAEVPMSVLLDKLPPEAWQDQRALARFLNDPDNKAWRTDGSRTF